jgi:peptidoglycan/xylan/chitin deacetylase (PgdA/CDA1 family)
MSRPLRRLGRGAREAWEVPRDLLLGRYPPFVTGGELPHGEVPVFVFHGVEPAPFARKLAYLADNGYVTLSADEYAGVIRGRRKAPPRAVVLTFDDGRGSVWTVAAPLLRKHGMKAVVFLVPGRTASRPGPLPPTWEDVEAGRVQASAALGREDDERALLSWEEIEALVRTELVDFQSHTLRHARVHTGPRLCGFVTPRSRRGYDAFDQPLLRDGDRDLLGDEAPLGAPLFHSAPRTSEELRFFEDPEVRRACVAEVTAAGGDRFFARSDWEARLRRLLRRTRICGRFETADERARAIRSELADARRLIEQHTGRPVVHLCYPWHSAGPTARQLAAEVGYESAFCGKVPGIPITRSGGDLREIARIGEDYMELLPGRGRATLAEVLRRKWARRFGGALR